MNSVFGWLLDWFGRRREQPWGVHQGLTSARRPAGLAKPLADTRSSVSGSDLFGAASPGSASPSSSSPGSSSPGSSLRSASKSNSGPLNPAPATSVPVNDVFTPTRPRAGRRTLVGREVERARILEAVLEETAHVVLYSERGRGKTSLSNLVVEALRRRGAIVARCACEAESTFDTMIRALARDLPTSLLSTQSIDSDLDGCEGLLPHRSLRPADVAAISRQLDCPFVVFVVDEFDRVTDLETRTRLADTIKLLSDREIKLYFIVVGVSDTLEQIIGQHPSIQRNIVPIHLPLLTDEEVAGMLTRGGEQAGIAFGPAAVQLVVRVARGMPYMAQLLGLRIAQAALRQGREQVEPADLLSAVDRLLAETPAPIVSHYASLLGAGPELDMGRVLHRLANAEQDRWGRLEVAFSSSQAIVGQRRVPLAAWSRLLSAGTLVQPDGEGGQVQFAQRALVYHVQLVAERSHLVAGGQADIEDTDTDTDTGIEAAPARLRSIVGRV